MTNPICPECKLILTHHICKVYGAVVCPQFSSYRGFDEVNDVWCKDCNQKTVQNLIFPEPVKSTSRTKCLQLPKNHTCRLCERLVCYPCYHIIGLCENYMQCKEFQEGKRNVPPIEQMLTSKRGASLQKTDSSSSSNSSKNDINDKCSAGT